MTRTVIMYRDSYNNDKISFPSPKERIEKKIVSFDGGNDSGLLLYLTKSGSISIRKTSWTYIIIDTEYGTKRFVLSFTENLYDKIKESTPEHNPGYDSDQITIGPIIININSAGITVTFDTPDYYNTFGSRR